jgi:hypothetical protein
MDTKETPPTKKPAPIAPKSQPPSQPPVKKIILHNKLPQMLPVSILDSQGRATEVKLQPNTASAPFEEKQLTLHTRRLVTLGHLRIRPA